MRLPVVHSPDDQCRAIDFGGSLVPYGSTVCVDIPGAHVWDGFAHDFDPARGVFVPTYRAWGPGLDTMAPIEERDEFPVLPRSIGNRDEW